ncbi:MAG: tail fiber domain-containing protein [Porticoccaceae bacterium]
MKNTILLKVWPFAVAILLASSGWGFTTNKDSQVTGADFKITKGPDRGGNLTFENGLIFDPPPDVGANTEPFILKGTGTNDTPVPFKIIRTTGENHALGGWKMQGINEDFYMAFKLGHDGADNILDLKSHGDIRFFTGSTIPSMLITYSHNKSQVLMRNRVRVTNSDSDLNGIDSNILLHVYGGPSIFENSSVTIGQSAPLTGKELSVNGHVGIIGDLYVQGKVYAQDADWGWSGDWSSDQRWKKDIKTLDNSLSKIAALRGVSYQWRQDEFPDKNFSKGAQIGVIAQEIEQIFPELVSEDDQGYKSVSYASLVAPLIEAVKALKQQNESQQAAIDDLAARLDALENK